MADNMSREQRSKTMSRIRSKNTRVELILRRRLFELGLRYRVHVPALPGRPDIAFTRRKLAVFVDGDFWHGWRFDEWAHKLTPDWRAKIARNRARDAIATASLQAQGWKVLRIWENELQTNPDRCVARVVRAVRGAEKKRNSRYSG
jgi:DNA mismatch endonuclease (patch repair protein)